MSQVHKVEVWLMVNESGEFEVGATEDECGEKFEVNCSTQEAVRKVCLKLRVPGPAVGAIALTAT